MHSNETTQMLVVLVPLARKDDIVDALMSVPFISGFNLFKIQGYSKAHSQFSVREQVEGFKDLFRFEVVHEPSQTQELLSVIGNNTGEPQLRYWILPVHQSGLV